MSIIPFRQRHAVGEAGLPMVRPEREPRASPRRTLENADWPNGAEQQRNWGVALALATWPLCLGATALFAVF